MDSFVKMINRIARLSALYREKEFKKLDLGEISQEALACKIFINKSNVARQLAQLEQKGFITRQNDEKDARRLRIFPTDKALAIEAEIRSILADWNQKLLAEIPTEQQQNLLSELQTIVEKAETVMCKKE